MRQFVRLTLAQLCATLFREGHSKSGNRVMRHTVILVPTEGTISVLIPAMPGCFSMGQTRDEALANAQQAIKGWIDSEIEQGRAPLEETPALVVAGVSQALQIIDEMRQAGETPADRGYELEVLTIEAPRPVLA